MTIPIVVTERSGICRSNEPVTVGVPIPKGTLYDVRTLVLVDREGQGVPVQARGLAQWSDRSLCWVLLDFLASVRPGEEAWYELGWSEAPAQVMEAPVVTVHSLPESVRVDTGRGTFHLNTKSLKPFDRVLVDGVPVLDHAGTCLVFTDAEGREHTPLVNRVLVEAAGPLRATVKFEGEVRAGRQGAVVGINVRSSFYAGSSVAELVVTMHNPRAAKHHGGLWDLGDEASLYFRDLSLHGDLAAEPPVVSHWRAEPGLPPSSSPAATVEIYQDSSGGENWRSANHVNRYGAVKQEHPGYRISMDARVVHEGRRATPVLGVCGAGTGLAGTILGFWQNFPKSLEASNGRLTLRLFPRQHGDLFELQGGEQKTHTVFLEFGKNGERMLSCAWVHHRLVPRASTDWYARSRAVPYLTSRDPGDRTEDVRLIDAAIEGERSFFARREIIDEYGWRHFGEVYADHEAVRQPDKQPLISHYNNQYDVIYGAAVQYLRTGDLRWDRLMSDLARHVIDIDIYHTKEDSPAYNGGLFWHTDHYTSAATATHRTYSRANAGNQGWHHYGGGPSNEHNYTTGLLLYYFLTGDEQAREAVLDLAAWVLEMEDGSRRPFGWLDRRPTGFASSTVSRAYHGPGRGAGNSINALLDAYVLTKKSMYLKKAEDLICRCIHPADAIEKRNLGDVEARWSYTVFLQVLAKYLDLKEEEGETGYMYAYARASLLHYATWMVEHEVPYKQVLDRVKIPSETWAAQDIRKANVFRLASKHADQPLRTVLMERAEFFFEACIKDLLSFDTWWLTRPVVILMGNSFVASYFRRYPEEVAVRPSQVYDFGRPVEFAPQLSGLYRMRERASALRKSLSGHRRPSFTPSLGA